jgi:hypothetical protein
VVVMTLPFADLVEVSTTITGPEQCQTLNYFRCILSR